MPSNQWQILDKGLPETQFKSLISAQIKLLQKQICIRAKDKRKIKLKYKTYILHSQKPETESSVYSNVQHVLVYNANIDF